jgi:thiol-disulfide isomerase/thioredoxin
MKFLAAGYESAGNAEGKRKIQDEILEEYPVSKAAQEILRDRWDKQHPYPRGSDKAQLEVWSRASVERYREWQRRWPKDSLLAFSLFTSLANLPEATAEEIGREGEAMLALYRRNPDWSSMPSMEHRVADAYLKYKASIDKVPALAEEGCRRTIERQEEQLQDDRLPDELRTAMQDSMVSAKLERARLLLDYYAAVKQPDKGREIELELAALSPAKAHGKASLLERRAQAAELLGHRLDALLLYREALRTRPPGRVFAAGEDKLAVNVERLWKELGGTAAAWPLLTEKAKATEATDSRWERPKNPLPSFSLTDLEGKTWKLAALEGKPVLINVWATWCGPCRSEHPAFQKLYDKLKDSGVAVLTFNVDDDLGKVAPYLKENRYTFPVLLARDVVDAVVPVVAIPQNWFVSAKGKLEWMQVGFGNEPNWEETMLAKLDEVRKQQ